MTHETIAAIAKTASYSTSAGMIFSSTADFMNHNVGVVGGLIGIATWLVNWYYRDKELKIKIKDNEK